MLRKWGSSVRGGIAASAVVLCGCGAGQKNTESPEGEDTRGGALQRSEPASPRILTPAPAPSGVVARLRVKNMGAIADGAMEAAGVPLDWRNFLEADKEEVPWATAIDWEGSIEGVLSMNVKNPQKPHGVFSVGVRAIAPVLSLLEGQNVSTLEGPGEVYYFEVSGEDCAVGPALGTSSARVVCSSERASLDVLLPYALRGLPTEQLSEADIHMEFEMEPVRAAYGKELKTFLRFAPAVARSQHQGNRTFDSALSDGAAEISREGTALLDELQRVTVEVEQESGDFTGTLNVELKGAESDVAKILLDFEARQKQVPPLFDLLPSSASSAGYSREIAKKHAQKWMSILADLMRGAAELEGASREFSKRLGAVIKQLGPSGETGVFARGPLISSTVAGKTELRSAWVVSGTTRSKEEVVKLLEDISWLLASNDIKKLVSRVPNLPKMQRKNLVIPGAAGATVFEWKLPPELIALAKFAGAQMSAEVDMQDMLDRVQSLETGLIAVHQIGEHTWLSWGQTKEELAESFGVLAGKDIERVGSLGALGGVRSEPSVASGFSRLEALVGMAGFLLSTAAAEDWAGLKKAMPNQGSVPVVYSFHVATDSLTKATWKLHVPAEFVRDLAGLGAKWAETHQTNVERLAP